MDPNQLPAGNGPLVPQLLDYQALSQMSDQDIFALFGIRDIFIQEIDFAGLAAAGTATGSFTVQQDANFLWQYGMYFADIAAAAQTDSTRVIPLVSVIITDEGSGRQLMQSAVPVPSLFGTGEMPLILPTPRFFRAQTQVSVSVTNFDAAATYNLKLSLLGTKFFKFS